MSIYRGINRPAQDIIVRGIKIDVVLLQIEVQLVRPQHLGNLHQLIVVIVPVEERCFAEDLKMEPHDEG